MRRYDDPKTKCLFGHEVNVKRLMWHNETCHAMKEYRKKGGKIYFCKHDYMH